MTGYNSDFLRTSFYGYLLIAEKSMYDWVQRKTHKKKRINKKWRKRYGYMQVPKRGFYITDDKKIYGHPVYIDRLIADVKIMEG